MTTIKLELNGFKELKEIFEQFPIEVQKSGTLDALKAGAKPMLEEAKSLVPVKSGKLKESLIIQSQKAGVLSVIKILASRKKGGYHAHLVELGTKPHTIENVVIGDKFYKQIEHPGAQKQPFLRPALLTKKDETIKIFAESLLKLTLKRFKKFVKKI